MPTVLYSLLTSTLLLLLCSLCQEMEPPVWSLDVMWAFCLEPLPSSIPSQVLVLLHQTLSKSVHFALSHHSNLWSLFSLLVPWHHLLLTLLQHLSLPAARGNCLTFKFNPKTPPFMPFLWPPSAVRIKFKISHMVKKPCAYVSSPTSCHISSFPHFSHSGLFSVSQMDYTLFPYHITSTLSFCPFISPFSLPG